MSNSNKGFLMFYDWRPLIESIPAKDTKKFLLAMINYAENDIDPPEFTGTTKVVAYSIFSAMRRYKESSKNGKKGAAKSAAQRQLNATDAEGASQPPCWGAGNTTQDEDNTDNNTATDTNMLFEQFWECYPKKVAKNEAQKIWMEIAPDAELCTKIISAVHDQKASAQWQIDNGRYIPYPKRWLSERRWDDTPANTPESNSTGTFDTNEFWDAAINKCLQNNNPE